MCLPAVTTSDVISCRIAVATGQGALDAKPHGQYPSSTLAPGTHVESLITQVIIANLLKTYCESETVLKLCLHVLLELA